MEWKPCPRRLGLSVSPGPVFRVSDVLWPRCSGRRDGRTRLPAAGTGVPSGLCCVPLSPSQQAARHPGNSLPSRVLVEVRSPVRCRLKCSAVRLFSVAPCGQRRVVRKPQGVPRARGGD